MLRTRPGRQRQLPARAAAVRPHAWWVALRFQRDRSHHAMAGVSSGRVAHRPLDSDRRGSTGCLSRLESGDRRAASIRSGLSHRSERHDPTRVVRPHLPDAVQREPGPCEFNRQRRIRRWGAGQCRWGAPDARPAAISTMSASNNACGGASEWTPSTSGNSPMALTTSTSC